MRKVVIALAAAAALATVAVTAAAAKPQAKGPSGNVTLAGWASSGTEFDFLNKVVANFEKKYPNIHVTYQPINGNYPQAMLARFASHTPPDVFYVDSSVAPDWIKQGVLQDLSPYIKQYKFRTKPFYPRLLQAFQSKGKTYGFPKDWSSLAMQTNTAMLQRASSVTTRRARLRSAVTSAAVRPGCSSSSRITSAIAPASSCDVAASIRRNPSNAAYL